MRSASFVCPEMVSTSESQIRRGPNLAARRSISRRDQQNTTARRSPAMMFSSSSTAASSLDDPRISSLPVPVSWMKPDVIWRRRSIWVSRFDSVRSPPSRLTTRRLAIDL